MKKTALFALWGVMFLLCAALGFIPEPEGSLGILLTLLSVAFFAPPALLASQAKKQRDRGTLALLRNLSAASLVLTLILLIVNFLSFGASEILGNILYALLIIVTTPMICSQYWVLSMFFWAFLMIFCAAELKKK